MLDANDSKRAADVNGALLIHMDSRLPCRDGRLGRMVVFDFPTGLLTTNMFLRPYHSARLYWIQAASVGFSTISVAKISTAIFWTGILHVAFATLHASRASAVATDPSVSIGVSKF